MCIRDSFQKAQIGSNWIWSRRVIFCYSVSAKSVDFTSWSIKPEAQNFRLFPFFIYFSNLDSSQGQTHSGERGENSTGLAEGFSNCSSKTYDDYARSLLIDSRARYSYENACEQCSIEIYLVGCTYVYIVIERSFQTDLTRQKLLTILVLLRTCGPDFERKKESCRLLIHRKKK